MLTILVYDDGRISVASDDADAENIRVEDCFRDAAETDLEDAWHEAPADDEGGVQLMFSPEDAERALLALTAEFFEADEALSELKKLRGDEEPVYERKPKP